MDFYKVARIIADSLACGVLYYEMHVWILAKMVERESKDEVPEDSLLARKVATMLRIVIIEIAVFGLGLLAVFTILKEYARFAHILISLIGAVLVFMSICKRSD